MFEPRREARFQESARDCCNLIVTQIDLSGIQPLNNQPSSLADLAGSPLGDTERGLRDHQQGVVGLATSGRCSQGGGSCAPPHHLRMSRGSIPDSDVV